MIKSMNQDEQEKLVDAYRITTQPAPTLVRPPSVSPARRGAAAGGATGAPGATGARGATRSGARGVTVLPEGGG